MFINKTVIATFLIGSLVLTLAGCSDPKGTTEAVEDMGMKDVSINGYSFFGCDENDTWHTSFEATNASGKRVSGVACAGVFKGTTVRITGRKD